MSPINGMCRYPIPMRMTAWLLVAFCAAPAVQAQSVIEWSPSRRLTKDDFKGRFPTSAANSSQSWLNIDASWECEGGRLAATARATFEPARSWWRPSQGNIWESAGERASGVSRTQLDARSSMLAARPAAARTRAVALRSHRAGGPENQERVRGHEGCVRGTRRHGWPSGRSLRRSSEICRKSSGSTTA